MGNFLVNQVMKKVFLEAYTNTASQIFRIVVLFLAFGLFSSKSKGGMDLVQ